MGLCSSCFQDSSAGQIVELPPITFHEQYHGDAVDLGEDKMTVMGDGIAFGNAPIAQNKGYWELKVIKRGEFRWGVAQKNADLSRQLGDDEHGWGLRSDGFQTADGSARKVVELMASEGDILGCTFSNDMRQCEFFHNGLPLDTALIERIKGTVFPAVSVSKGAVLQANFGRQAFTYPPPPGFSALMIEQDIL